MAERAAPIGVGPLVRVERRPLSGKGPIRVRWDAWDAGGRHYRLTYEAPFGRVQLDDGRELTQFHRRGVYRAVIALDEFLRLAQLRYEPAGADA